MTPQIATYLFVSGIVGLFFLDYDREVRVSKALCLPFIYLLLISTRSVTEWVAIAETGRPLAATATGEMYIEGTPLDRNVQIMLMVLALMVLLRRRRLIGSFLRANLPVVLFFLFAASSVFWSDYPEVTIRRWFKAVGILLMVLVVLSEDDWDSATRRLFVWAGFLLIPLSILVIKYYPAIGRSYVVVNISTWELVPVGVTTHKNSLGSICEVYGIAFLWHFLAAYQDRLRLHRTRHLIAHGAALVMVSWLFLQANSVTAQSCFLLATAFLIASCFRTFMRKQWMVHVLALIFVGIPSFTLFLGIGGDLLKSMGRDSTLTGRTLIWERVIALVDNQAVGTGFESFWLGKRLDIMRRYQVSLNEAHNGYIEIYATLGCVGLLLLTIILLVGYRRITESFRRNKGIATLKLTYFLTVIVSSFTEAAFRTDGVSMFLLLLLVSARPEKMLGSSDPKLQVTTATSTESLSEPVGAALVPDVRHCGRNFYKHPWMRQRVALDH